NFGDGKKHVAALVNILSMGGDNPRGGLTDGSVSNDAHAHRSHEGSPGWIAAGCNCFVVVPAATFVKISSAESFDSKSASSTFFSRWERGAVESRIIKTDGPEPLRTAPSTPTSSTANLRIGSSSGHRAAR